METSGITFKWEDLVEFLLFRASAPSPPYRQRLIELVMSKQQQQQQQQVCFDNNLSSRRYSINNIGNKTIYNT